MQMRAVSMEYDGSIFVCAENLSTMQSQLLKRFPGSLTLAK